MKRLAVRGGGKADGTHYYLCCMKTPIKEANESSKSEYNYHKADCFQKAINPGFFITSRHNTNHK